MDSFLGLGFVFGMSLSVSALTFDNSSCLAAGLTCSISLSGYSGAGFFGFFTTGITNVSIATFGSGFVCDWACFLTLHSTGMGAEQACPVHNATCHSSSAIIFLGNTTKIVSYIMMFCARIQLVLLVQSAEKTVYDYLYPAADEVESVTGNRHEGRERGSCGHCA